MVLSKESTPVVLITGCSLGGIGDALARAFLAANCKVVATACRLESIAELAAQGALTLALDVTSTRSIKQAVEQAIQQTGRIDILVNNAGLALIGPLAEVDLDEARGVFEANYWGLLATTQAVVPHMAERRSGTIINIASIAGWIGSPFSGIYGGSKAAVEATTHTLRVELKPFGINVMLVCPGAIKSNIGNNNLARLDASSYNLYRSYAKGMEARAVISQQSPTPTEEFASALVSRALRRRGPPRLLVLGKMSGLYSLLRHLPLWLIDRLLAKKFSLDVPAPVGPFTGTACSKAD